jgi:hypothetical protein
MARYCTKCGKEIDDEAIICVNCGCSTTPTKKNVEPDSDSVGWGFLGFFIPLVGLILWLVWKDEAPKKAKSLGIGALVSVCIDVVGGIIALILWAVGFGLMITETGAIVSSIASTLTALI